MAALNEIAPPGLFTPITSRMGSIGCHQNRKAPIAGQTVMDVWNLGSRSKYNQLQNILCRYSDPKLNASRPASIAKNVWHILDGVERGQ
jgi:hypothetical protein